MTKNKNLNPLMLVLGVIAGAAGAFLMTDAKARKQARVTLAKASKKGSTGVKSLVGRIKKIASDAEALNKQGELDAAKPKTAAKTKK